MEFKKKSSLWVPDYQREWIVPPKRQPSGYPRYRRYLDRSRMAVTHIQSIPGVNNFGFTSTDNTFSSPAGTGILIASVNWLQPSGTSTVTSITDDKSNPYNTGAGSWIPLTVATRAGTTYSNIYQQIFYIIGPITGVAHVTANFSVSVNGFITLFEATAGVFDQEATGTGGITSAGTLTVNTITTGSNGSYGVAGLIAEDGTGTDQFTAGSGWTLVLHSGGGSGCDANEYIAQTTAGALNGDFAQAFAVGVGWAGSMATFKPAGAGARYILGTH